MQVLGLEPRSLPNPLTGASAQRRALPQELPGGPVLPLARHVWFWHAPVPPLPLPWRLQLWHAGLQLQTPILRVMPPERGDLRLPCTGLTIASIHAV